MSKADIPAVKKQSGLLRTDGKRQDGVTIADRKTVPLTQAHLFIAIVAETMGAINSDGIEFLDDLVGASLQSLMTTARKLSVANS